MIQQRTSNLFRRIGAGLACALGVVALVQPVEAATVYLTGGTVASCTYSSVSGDGNGNITYICGTVSSSGPGTLSFSTAGPVSVAPSGTTTVAVNRTGGSTGAVTAVIGVSAGCLASTASVSFADASATPNPTSITLTVPASGSCTLTITSTTGGASPGAPLTFQANVTDPNAAVTFAFSPQTSSTTFGGAMVPITVTRTGGTAGNWNVPILIAGTMTTEPGTGNGTLLPGGGTITPVTPPTTPYLNFPAGSQSAVINYTPPATPPSGVTTPATIILGLGTPVIVGTLPPGQTASAPPVNHYMTIGPAAPAPPSNGCTTTATNNVPWATNTITYSALHQNETVAFALTIGPGTLDGAGNGKFTVGDTTSTGSSTDIEMTVSACPGDFSSPSASSWPCMQHTAYTGGVVNFRVTPGQDWYCTLPTGTTTAYLNVRQVKRPLANPPVPSCGYAGYLGTCPFTVNFN
jgi:hypothetical protein